MSREINYFVASKGEGKTRWLLDLAHSYQHSGKTVFLCCETSEDFADFCEKYFYLFGEGCRAHSYTNIWNVNKTSVVLVDNLLNCSISPDDIKCLQINEIPVFITLEGTTIDSSKIEVA